VSVQGRLEPESPLEPIRFGLNSHAEETVAVESSMAGVGGNPYSNGLETFRHHLDLLEQNLDRVEPTFDKNMVGYKVDDQQQF